MGWQRWFRKGGDPGEIDPELLLREPSRFAGDRLVPLLLVCGTGTPERARAAAREIHDTLARLAPSALPRVDAWVREDLSWGSGYALPGWMKTPDAVDHLCRRTGDDVAVLCVLSSHPSGYVREAAVARIAAVGDGGLELPFLLLRAYDWVGPIRRRAEEAALERLASDRLPRVLECLGLLLRLEDRLRDGGLVAQRAVELLRAPAARGVLRDGLRSAERSTRLRCFAWLAEDDGGLADVVTDVLASPDPVLRGAAARAALRLPRGSLAALVPVLLADGSPRVRMQGVVLAGRAGAEPPLLDAALDVNATVRLVARAELKRRGRTIEAAFYRAALECDPVSPGALAGLAETATEGDVDVVERYLASPRARLRRIAVAAFARLRRNDAVPALTRMLADPSPKVSRIAAIALRGLPVSAGDLATLYEGSVAAHVRRNALGLLVRRAKWDGLAWTLRACGDPDPRIAEMGRGELDRWILRANRSYAEPTSAQLGRIGAALRDSAAALAPTSRKRLMEMLPAAVKAAMDEAA